MHILHAFVPMYIGERMPRGIGGGKTTISTTPEVSTVKGAGRGGRREIARKLSGRYPRPRTANILGQTRENLERYSDCANRLPAAGLMCAAAASSISIVSGAAYRPVSGPASLQDSVLLSPPQNRAGSPFATMSAARSILWWNS